MAECRDAPEDRRYSANHLWVRKDGEMCEAGITEYAQNQLGQIVYVDVPEEGAGFAQGQEFGTIESVKAVNQLLMPVSGEVAAINSALENDPALINNDCYGRGWLIRMKPTDWSEYDRLLDAQAYRSLVKTGR